MRWRWQGDNSLYTDVKQIELKGMGDHVEIERVDLDFGNNKKATLKGTAALSKRGIKIDLDLNSPLLSGKTVDGFLENIKKIHDKITSFHAKRSKEWEVTGNIDFEVANFISGPVFRHPGDTKAETELHWQPINGVIHLQPGGKTSIDFAAAKTCCLQGSGIWYSDPGLGQSEYKLTTACDPPPQFQDLLPCFGIKQDVIEGGFSLKGRIKGERGNWQDGNLEIISQEGRILRLSLLAKIFKVVNLTDLFTTYANESGDKRGFPYKNLTIEADIKDNFLIIRKAVLYGEGLNLFARGKMNIITSDIDFTVLIAPFKTLDAIISKVPLIGRVIGGENATVITIPVGLRGPINDPEVIPLAPDAIGIGILNMVKDTLLLPFRILSPILPDADDNSKDK